jgi:hypothetical protein
MESLRVKNPFYLSSIVTIIVVLMVLLTASLFGAPKNSNSGGNPKISWTPSVLNASISAGSTNSFKVSFIATENIENAVLWVAPKLQSFVKIRPASFISIAPNQPVSVDVIITTPAGMLPQTLSGTIHLRNGNGNNKTFPEPLPIAAVVQWKPLKQYPMGIAVTYPPTYITTFNDGTNSQEIAFSENQESYDASLVPALVISTDLLPTDESVRDWIHSFAVSDANITTVSIGNRSYLKWSEIDGEGDGSAISYSTAAPNNKAITFTVHSSSLAQSPALDTIISSLTFTAP